MTPLAALLEVLVRFASFALACLLATYRGLTTAAGCAATEPVKARLRSTASTGPTTWKRSNTASWVPANVSPRAVQVRFQ